MPDALKRIFAENLYPKQKDRNWERVADRCGDELCGEMMDMFPHQEQALCAVVHAMASLIIMAKKEKRIILLERLKDAVLDRMQILQEEEDDMGPGEGEEDEIDSEEEVDFSSVPERPSPEPQDDDDSGLEDEDPNESMFNDNKPTSQAGFQPKRRRPDAK